MTSLLTTTTLVRQRSGVTSAQVDDTVLQAIIDQTEALVNRRFNTRFVPTTDLHIFSGGFFSQNPYDSVVLPKSPVLRLRSVTAGTTDITLTDTDLRGYSGVVTLKSSASRRTFDSTLPATNKVLYDYGWLEVDTSVAPLPITNAETAGTSVVIEMASTSGLTNGNYVRIAGTDGYEEVTTITALSANTSITATIFLPHAAGSYVWKVQTPAIVLQYATIIAALGAITTAIGGSPGNISAYSLEGLSVTRESKLGTFQGAWNSLMKEKEMIESTIHIFPTVG